MNIVKNIIIVCDFGYIEGGASRVAHESAIALSQEYNVTLFTAVDPISEELSKSNVSVVSLHQFDILNNNSRLEAIAQGIWNKKAKYEFERVLEKFQPENTIIHVHTWTKGISSSIFKIIERHKFKVALTVHDFFLVCPNGGLFDYKKQKVCECNPLSITCITKNCDSRSYFHKIFRVVRQIVQNNNIRKCNNISYIFISEFAKMQLMKRKPNIRNCYFIQNPINFENKFKVDCANNDIYLYLGRLTEDKGIRIFCDAVTKAGVKAVVIGKGILENELKEKYPNIKFEGWKNKSEMAPYIKKTRCLIFSSIYYEGSPLTPLEMMACGIPNVVSNINSSKDLIIEGLNGFLYNGYNVNELVKCIEKTKDNNIILKMNEYILKNFQSEIYSMTKHIESLIEVYNKILNNDNRSTYEKY